MTTLFGINEDAIEKLNNISDNLNKKTQEMNENIESVEKTLVKSGIGVSVWTDNTFSVTNTEGRTNTYRIGFCRIADEWKIVCQVVYEDGKGGRVIPLLTATRIVRMEAVALLDELVTKLMEKAEAFLKDVTEKNEKVSSIKSGL
jgi:uncharacterized protein YoxC